MIRRWLLGSFLTLALAAPTWASEGAAANPPHDAADAQAEHTEAQMRTWEERMRELGRQADRLSEQTRTRLHRAWEETQDRWETLREASRQQWDKANARLADAMQRLERAWEAATEEQQTEGATR